MFWDQWIHFSDVYYKHFLFISKSSQKGRDSFFYLWRQRVTQRLSDLPRVTGESVAGTQQGALTQRHLLSAQGNATQLLCSLKPGLSYPLLMTPVNSQWVSVCQEFSQTPRRMMDFKKQLYITEDNPKERWSEAHRGKHIPVECGLHQWNTDPTWTDTSTICFTSFKSSFPSPHAHRTFLCRVRAIALHTTGVSVFSAPSNAG